MCIFNARNFDGRVNGIEAFAQIALNYTIFTNRCLLQRDVPEYFEQRQWMCCCHLNLLTKISDNNCINGIYGLILFAHEVQRCETLLNSILIIISRTIIFTQYEPGV